MVTVSLYYEQIGAGEPLLLLHAGIADSSMWDDQVEAFSARYRVIRFDAQGFGRSATAEQPLSRAEDVYQLMRELDIPRAHVVGVSMGGSAAIDFAVSHPEMVGSLIPVAAGLSGYQGKPDPWLAEQDALEEAACERGDFEAAAEVALRAWLAGPGRKLGDMDAGLRERAYRLALHAEQRSAELKPTPQLDPPAAERLGDITAPTLVIVPDEDVQFIREIGDVLVSGIHGAQKLIIKNAAHMVNMERPTEFNQAVLDFVGTHPLATGSGGFSLRTH
jgi:3-oxoadipate enol-lactonase